MKTNRYDTIETIAVDVCRHMGDPDAKNIAIVLAEVVRVVDQLNFNLALSVKTDKVVISKNFTATLPPDFIDMIKAGILLKSGYLRIMGEVKDLVLQPDPIECTCQCKDKEEQIETGEVVDPTTFHQGFCPACTFHNISRYRYGEWYGYRPKMYANGKYRIDKPNYRMLFDTSGYDVSEGTEIWIEYRAYDIEERYQRIPRQAFQMIRARALHQLLMGTPQAEQYMNQFRIEYDQYKSQFDPSPEEIVNAMRGNYRNTIKR